jgi:hypothetical protein
MSSARSAFGAALEAARLRCPPRERPVWKLVVEELRRHRGRMAIDDLVRVIADKEQLATPYEVRRAIRGMRGAGHLNGFVQPVSIVRAVFDADGKLRREVVPDVPTEVVELVDAGERRRPEPLTPEQRWAREDAELEAFCQGHVPCRETRSARREPDDLTLSFFSPQRTVMTRLFGRDRVVLERVYGPYRDAPRRDVFGEVAPIIELTESVTKLRAKLATATGREPTLDDALRRVLDHEPQAQPAASAWRSERRQFIMRTKAEAERILAAACDAFRRARGQ